MYSWRHQKKRKKPGLAPGWDTGGKNPPQKQKRKRQKGLNTKGVEEGAASTKDCLAGGEDRPKGYEKGRNLKEKREAQKKNPYRAKRVKK